MLNALAIQPSSAAAVSLAKQDDQMAANLTASVLKGGPEQDRTAVAVVQRWAQKSPWRLQPGLANFRTRQPGRPPRTGWKEMHRS